MTLSLQQMMIEIAAVALGQSDATASGANGGAATPTPAGTTSLWQYIQGGGAIGYVLIVLSVLAVALMIAHLVQVRMSKLAPPDIAAGIERLLRENDVAGALEFSARPEHASFLANVFRNALTRCANSPFGLLEMRSALEEAGQREVDRAMRTTDGIAIIAAVGPMLGLLGTVIGMIGAFGTIGKLEGTARSTELASYMSLALITTAEGLIVAIPCTIAYSIFRRRVERLAGEVAELVERISSHLQQSGAAPRAVTAPRPAQRPVPQPIS